MPYGSIICRYLRIHITSILVPSDLETKRSGFSITEINGFVLSSDSDLTSKTVDYLSPFLRFLKPKAFVN